MKLKLGKRSVLLISFIAVLFILSILIYFLADNTLNRRVLFFQGRKSYSAEIRRIPRQKSIEGNIELFVQELILGPYSIDHSRAIPEGTKLQSLFLRHKSLLYIDFSADFVVTNDGFGMVPSEMVVLVRKNLEYNFPFLDKIIISVDGQTL